MESKKFKKEDDEGMPIEFVGVAVETPVVDVREPEATSRKHEDVYKVDEENLRRIFPEETWKIILNQLDQEDRENCANATPYFRELLHQERVVFLYPKVIGIMAPIFEQKYDVCKVSTVELDDTTNGEPGVMATNMDAGEWTKIVLNCRLVCSTWNKAIENCYERPEMAGIPEFLDELDPRPKMKNVRDIRWTKQNISVNERMPYHFMARFEESHNSGICAPPKNPFFGRYLLISVSPTLIQSISIITKLLEQFGKEIWYLELKIESESSIASAFIFYQILGTWLSLVPNLQFLQIHSEYRIPELVSRNGHIVNITERAPLPKLEKLRVISVKHLGIQMRSELIRRNCHVTHLNILDVLDEDIGNSLEMSNLQGFSALDSPNSHKVLETLGPTWTKLKKLYLGRLHMGDLGKFGMVPVGVSASQSFLIFQRNWAETLTDLHLEHPFGFDMKTNFEESKALRLKLPGVKRLTLCLSCSIFLNFALELKNSLEHLVLQFENDGRRTWYKERVEKEQEIELVGFEDRMQESNIWQVFGKLKTIKLQNVRILDKNFTLFTKENEKFIYSQKNL